jgi:hypothetical protein
MASTCTRNSKNRSLVASAAAAALSCPFRPGVPALRLHRLRVARNDNGWGWEGFDPSVEALAGGPGFDLSFITNESGCTVLRVLCEGRELKPSAQVYRHACAALGAIRAAKMSRTKLSRQHRRPPLQRTQGWGTLCRNGACELRCRSATRRLRAKGLKVMRSAYRSVEAPRHPKSVLIFSAIAARLKPRPFKAALV